MKFRTENNESNPNPYQHSTICSMQDERILRRVEVKKGSNKNFYIL